MPRPNGRIPTDVDYKTILQLRIKMERATPSIIPFYDNLLAYMRKFPKLQTGTGDWYINFYYKQTRKVFFKLDTKQIHECRNCLHISIFEEDYYKLPDHLKLYVLEKPGGFFKHGKFPYQASIKEESDLIWAKELLDGIYNIAIKTV